MSNEYLLVAHEDNKNDPFAISILDVVALKAAGHHVYDLASQSLEPYRICKLLLPIKQHECAALFAFLSSSSPCLCHVQSIPSPSYTGSDCVFTLRAQYRFQASEDSEEEDSEEFTMIIPRATLMNIIQNTLRLSPTVRQKVLAWDDWGPHGEVSIVSTGDGSFGVSPSFSAYGMMGLSYSHGVEMRCSCDR